MRDIVACREYIEAALAYAGGSHSFDDVAAMVADGRAQLWPAPDSAVVTEIIDYPNYRALNFWLAGGNLEELRRMEPGILEWAKTERGCTKAFLTGRRGWERSFLRDTGWEPKLVVLEKVL